MTVDDVMECFRTNRWDFFRVALLSLWWWVRVCVCVLRSVDGHNQCMCCTCARKIPAYLSVACQMDLASLEYCQCCQLYKFTEFAKFRIEIPSCDGQPMAFRWKMRTTDKIPDENGEKWPRTYSFRCFQSAALTLSFKLTGPRTLLNCIGVCVRLDSRFDILFAMSNAIQR